MRQVARDWAIVRTVRTYTRCVEGKKALANTPLTTMNTCSEVENRMNPIMKISLLLGATHIISAPTNDIA